VKRSTWRLLRDYGSTILLAIVAALLIRSMLVEAYRIPTASMRPALLPGDTIFVGKWAYGVRAPFDGRKLTEGEAPRRGDVVVFTSPTDPSRQYIKRVVGLAGDTVSLKAGQLSLNGKPLRDETGRGAQAASGCGTERLPGGKTYGVCWESPQLDDLTARVPEGSVFVVGDLRSRAAPDTRRQKSWGVVPVSLLKGKALWIWLSVEPRERAGSGLLPKLRTERMFRRIE
jgi:signal peptidase I